jgi:hypothetical protein
VPPLLDNRVVATHRVKAPDHTHANTVARLPPPKSRLLANFTRRRPRKPPPSPPDCSHSYLHLDEARHSKSGRSRAHQPGARLPKETVDVDACVDQLGKLIQVRGVVAKTDSVFVAVVVEVVQQIDRKPGQQRRETRSV